MLIQFLVNLLLHQFLIILLLLQFLIALLLLWFLTIHPEVKIMHGLSFKFFAFAMVLSNSLISSSLPKNKSSSLSLTHLELEAPYSLPTLEEGVSDFATWNTCCNPKLSLLNILATLILWSLAWTNSFMKESVALPKNITTSFIWSTISWKIYHKN